MLDELINLLSFSPVLVMAFAGMSMVTVQMLKESIPWVGRNASTVSWLMSLFYATMVVLEVTVVLQISIIAFVIMTSASGIYESRNPKEKSK